MKKFFVLVIVATLFIACQNKPQRYFETSTEIEILKKGITAYEAQDWDTWKANFVDTAKIFHNSNKGASPDELMAGFKDRLTNFSSYGFSKEGAVYEMVIDKQGETWVNYWNSWQGKTKETNETLTIPVHLTAQFIDGKIVKEYAYYDTAGMNAALSGVEDYKALPDNEKTILANINSFIDEHLNKRDLSNVSSILADDYKRFFSDELVATGAKELVTNLEPFFSGFPDFHVKMLHKSTIVDNAIFVHWRMTGTHTNDFSGIPPSGKKVKVNGLSRLHFNNNGKMDMEHLYFDQLGLMQQIGKTLN